MNAVYVYKLDESSTIIYFGTQWFPIELFHAYCLMGFRLKDKIREIMGTRPYDMLKVCL